MSLTCQICGLQPLRMGLLTWCLPCGVGESILPATGNKYDHGYAMAYLDLAHTPMAEALTQIRVDTVRQVTPAGGRVLDFGCGAGQFVQAARMAGFEAIGYEPMLAWQSVQHIMGVTAGISTELTDLQCDTVTFFDSLEHVERLDKIFALLDVPTLVVTIPVYAGDPHLISTWKHAKVDEHVLYVTDTGFRRLMHQFGYATIAVHDKESQAGRQDVRTYTLRRGG